MYYFNEGFIFMNVFIPKWMQVLESKLKDNLINTFGLRINEILNSESNTILVLLALYSLKKELNELHTYESKKSHYCYSLKSSSVTLNILNCNIKKINKEIQKIIILNPIISDEEDLIIFNTHFANTYLSNYDEQELIDDYQANVSKPLYQDYLNKVAQAKVSTDRGDISFSEAINSDHQSTKTHIDGLETIAFDYLDRLVEFKHSKSKLLHPNSENAALLTSASDNNISLKTIESLQSAIKDSIPKSQAAKDYLFNKTDGTYLKNMRIRNAEYTHNDSGLTITYNDGLAFIKKAFSSISKDMVDFVTFMDDNGYIEHAYNPDKGGACAINYQTVANFSIVLINYTDDVKSVITLAHELGHAYHHKMLSEISDIEGDYPLVFAETASMFAENVIIKLLMKEYKNSNVLSIIRHERVVKAFDLMIMVPSRFDLEYQIFDLKNKDELNLESLRTASLNNTLLWYGESDGIETANDWLTVRHYFMPDHYFYNYPYYFGYLLNAFLIEETNSDEFSSKFETFLKLTGSKDARAALLDSFGFDMESKDFWLKAISKTLNTLDEDLIKLS